MTYANLSSLPDAATRRPSGAGSAVGASGSGGGGGAGAGPVGGRRVKSRLARRIVIGTYAARLAPEEETRRRSQGDGATHRWSCVVRAPNCEDTSYYIRRVVFTLHNSFLCPVRSVEKPPYEVTEVGWGEFEIVVKIHFIDNNERPIELRHWLRLYPVAFAAKAAAPPHEGPVVSETHDEIIFEDPTERMCEALLHSSGLAGQPISYTHQQLFLDGRSARAAYLGAVLAGVSAASREAAEAKERLVSAVLEAEKLRELSFNFQDGRALAIFNEAVHSAQRTIGDDYQAIFFQT